MIRGGASLKGCTPSFLMISAYMQVVCCRLSLKGRSKPPRRYPFLAVWTIFLQGALRNKTASSYCPASSASYHLRRSSARSLSHRFRSSHGVHRIIVQKDMDDSTFSRYITCMLPSAFCAGAEHMIRMINLRNMFIQPCVFSFNAYIHSVM